MVKFSSALIFGFATLAEGSYPKIAGYEPGSDVTQHNAIDLDQKEMEAHLGLAAGPDYEAAKAIYMYGANSGAHAQFTVPGLATALPKGTAVTQAGSTGTGTVKSTAAEGATTIKVTYTSTCKEGGTSTKDVTGCFSATGDLTIGDAIVAPTELTNKYRNLAGFSTAAKAKMAQPPQKAYVRAKAFYDTIAAYDGEMYGHSFVTKALDGTGPFDGVADAGRIECAKKGSAYMNVWLYTIREFEDAIQDCQSGCIDCNDDPVHAWDEGVAFYTGTLEGTAPGGNSAGKLLYRLAEKRCSNFGTCHTHDGVTMSEVNEVLFEKFTLGKVALQQGQCSSVPAIRDEIISLMTVPLVQGTLRYAYKMEKLQGGAKEKGEGAAFAGAVLGMVHHCDATAASTIYANMKIEGGTAAVDFAAVKAAFESVYSCLGITCAHIGGLEISDGSYYAGAEPCSDAAASAGVPLNAHFAVAGTVALTALQSLTA